MTANTDVKLADIISPAFFTVHQAIKQHRYTHFVLRGGRGSTKSSFVSIEIILGMMKNPQSNGVAFRKHENGLAASVFTQLRWAIDILGVSHLWKAMVSPLKLIYLPTGQEILFRGTDDPIKLKSIKPRQGYFKYIWFEEWAEFNGIEDTRNVLQSVMRGGGETVVFYSFNPPKSKNNWVNIECQEKRPSRTVHHSTYKDVPVTWLGDDFIVEAEHLALTKPQAYEHEYMGVATGTGGDIFENVSVQSISDDTIKHFDRITYGVDFGFSVDPMAFVAMHYDKMRKTLYIFDEVYGQKLSDDKAIALIKPKLISKDAIIADSADPKSIAYYRSKGLRVQPAQKGPDSVDYGIKYMQSLDRIIIDNMRCPNAAREFIGYEYERNKRDEFISRYPDIDNHTIDAARYAMEPFIRGSGLAILK